MIERGATRIGLNNGGLTPSQLNGSTAKFVQLFSKMLGISLGCFAGMLPLVFLSPPKVEFTYEDLQVYNATFGPNGVTTQQFADMMESAAGGAVPRPGTSSPRLARRARW
ncbi:unnamed protein product [Prorocentrum cordatum]|uniref:Uncharacterized protein n=1 Tax=Prorocentrum cordatum TaxID=2364126 RepID=A0ABN9WLW4_9DINO|nr:unnamed protein product [Polarella glacialis]